MLNLTFVSSVSKEVISELPKVSRLCFGFNVLARRRASVRATNEFIITADFRPRFLSNLGDRTESSSIVIALDVELRLCSGNS